ncbi:MAG: hypothetical protein GY866_43445 [Proteobacteria bacterium]|nr:hypothetical protein [Pseudomonadota bacterium]
MEHERVGWRIRLAFGVGQYAEGVKGSSFGIFLLFYYTSVKGLSGTMAGSALLIALCFDGVTDPLMGSISDAFKSRWGRRHPFMYGSALPFAASFYLLFCPPDNLNQIQLFVWLAVFAVLTRGFMTVYSVPHMSMNAELTNDHTERTSLSAIRSFFSLAGYLSVATGGFIFFFRATPKFANGQLNPAAYPFFALVFSITMVIAIWLSAIGTHSEIPRLPQASDEVQPLRFYRISNEIRSALQISSFRRIIGAGFLFSAMMGTMQALVIFALTFFWGMTSREIGIAIPITIAGTILGTIFARQVSTFIGEKKQTYMVGMVWFAVFSGSTFLLRLIDVFPPNGHPSILPAVAITNAIAYAGWGVCGAIIASMIADVTDEHERVYCVRQEGIYYGAASLMGKVASGFGSFLAGIVTDVSGVSGLTDPTTADSTVLLKFGLIWGPLPLFVSAMAVFMIRRYDIDRARHEKILEEIERRTTDDKIKKKG